MSRLTTNKEVKDMGMYELAHNCCYEREGVARYRDFEMDMDARDFARNLMATLTDDELPLDDDNFDEEILENLQYDPFSNVTGLIALFYRNLWAMADLREKLKECEDAEEHNNGWITDRNPTKEECKNNRFWITDSDRWSYEADFDLECERWRDLETGGFINVIAWHMLPLPAPYQPKGE